MNNQEVMMLTLAAMHPLHLGREIDIDVMIGNIVIKELSCRRAPPMTIYTSIHSRSNICLPGL
jgi:hypothetical protein